MLKKILISAGIIVLVMGLTVGAIYIVQQQPFSAEGSNESELVLDLSKDYGACDTLDTSAVQTALGEAADTIQPAKNTGISEIDSVGDSAQNVVADSQTCVYAFEPGGSPENGFNATNSLTVQITQYTNQAGADAIVTQIQGDPTASKVESLADAAFFVPSNVVEGPDATASFDLHVFEGTEHTTYSIRQPAESTTFTAESARTALVSLAQ